MTTLSTEDTTRQSANDRDPDSLNPVIEIMGPCWQRLFAPRVWKPQRLPFRVFLQEQAHTPAPWAAWGKIRRRTHQAKPVGEGTTERCPMRKGSGNFFEPWML